MCSTSYVKDISDHLPSLCTIHGLAILGSCFQHLDIHLWTWILHDDYTQKRLDHTLTHQRDRYLFKFLHIFWSPECPAIPVKTPVISFLVVKLVKTKYNQSTCPLNVQNLDLQSWYNLDARRCWITVVRHRSNICQPWLSEDTFDLLKLKAEARLRNDQTERKWPHGIFKARTKWDWTTYLSCIADKADDF